ncbi:MAG TPA: adenylate/guanylate cyclase domain-containing protein [Puia sp.]|jgi:class 3 adenylate cyclase|nr:adenylate/guanylate cyclase domain-containing protein [Puia sp.]
MSIINRIIDLGVNEQTTVVHKKQVRFSNSVSLIVCFFILQNCAICVYYHQTEVDLIYLTHFLLITLIPVFNSLGKRIFASAWFSSVAIFFVSIYSIVFTESSYNFTFLPMIIFLQFFLFSAAEKKYVYIFAGIDVICFGVVLYWPHFHLPNMITVSNEIIQAEKLNTLIGLPCLSIAFGAYAFFTINKAENDVAREKEKTEQLLLNILPRSIAERFKNDRSFLAEEYGSVTVLFADIVSFTQLSEKLKPDVLVGFLNTIFSRFDELAELNGLEKIKTIGDAYMVAGGVPVPSVDHARKICGMALQMQKVVKEMLNPFEEQISIRIGINTGPVTAGVIGVKKFIYDLWGDAVNTASRMESHAEAGKIHITHDVYELVKNEFDCECRGLVNIKGKRPMMTYFLTGIKESA